MSGIATPYEDLLRDVLANGTHKSDRTATGTRSVFGRQLRFDLADGFPLITTKRVHFKSIAFPEPRRCAMQSALRSMATSLSRQS